MAKPTQPVRGRPKRSSSVPLTGSSGLDRSSDVPLYFQLAAALKVMLEVGRLGGRRPLCLRARARRRVRSLAGGDQAGARPSRRRWGHRPGQGVGRLRRCRRGARSRWPGWSGCGWSPTTTGRSPCSARASASPTAPCRTSSRSRIGSTPIAHVTAVVDVGEPSVYLVDSFSTVAHVPWLLPTAQALEAGAKPPVPSGLDLTRATVSVEHTFFGEWGSSQVGAISRRSGPDGALRPVRPRQGLEAGAPARVRPPRSTAPTAPSSPSSSANASILERYGKINRSR